MKDMMEYKGYFGSVHYSDEDRVFHGKIEFIRSLVTYEGTSVKGLRSAFKEAVDDYLDLCAETGKKPEKPFKGTFNVRSGSTLHREAVMLAQRTGASLNTVVVEALKKHLGTKSGKHRKTVRG